MKAQNQSSQGLSLLLDSISGCREFRKNCKCNGRNVNGRGLYNLLDLYFFLFKKKIKSLKTEITLTIREEVLPQRRMEPSPMHWYNIQSKPLFSMKLFKIFGLCQFLKVKDY